MNTNALVITSIASDQHPVLRQFARETSARKIPFIVMGDAKSPAQFTLDGCDFYSLERQASLGFALAKTLPTKHYARKNLGYLVAIKNGAQVLLETDDDNIPYDSFWNKRELTPSAHALNKSGWVNLYKFFSTATIWPRGFALEHLQDALPTLAAPSLTTCPIQQGLADDNPDVDALYRLTQTLPIKFSQHHNIALGNASICPFNSQNTTWFKQAFPLLYLPSYCSFRMTDIWRSFIAQRILWTCDWHLLFHNSTVRQERNEHHLLKDFEDEISGYLHNKRIMDILCELDLKSGAAHITENLQRCYAALVKAGFIGNAELPLLEAWIADIERYT